MASSEHRGHVVANVVAGSLTAALGGYLVIAGAALGFTSEVTTVGPGGFPAVTGLILLVLGVLLALTARLEAARASEDTYLPDRAGWRKLLVTAGAVVLFCVVLNVAGYVPTMFLFLLVLSLRVSRLNVWAAVILAGSFSLASFYLFYRGLGVPLPVSPYLPVPTFGY